MLTIFFSMLALSGANIQQFNPGENLKDYALSIIYDLSGVSVQENEVSSIERFVLSLLI